MSGKVVYSGGEYSGASPSAIDLWGVAKKKLLYSYHASVVDTFSRHFLAFLWMLRYVAATTL